MTFDQFTHLLAVLAWPAVALIASVSAVRCCRLLIMATDSWIRSIERAAYHVSGTISGVHGYWSATYYERRQAEIATAGRANLGKTAETALMTLLATNGGFPGTANDDAVRQIVREVRKLYEEVEKPTPEPVGAKEKLRAPMVDADDLALDELFGPEVVGVDEEEMEL